MAKWRDAFQTSILARLGEMPMTAQGTSLNRAPTCTILAILVGTIGCDANLTVRTPTSIDSQVMNTQSENRVKPPTKHSVTLEGLNLEVTFPETIIAGEPAVVQIALRNERNEKAFWAEHNGYHELGLQVRGPANTPCPLTNFGRKKLPSEVGLVLRLVERELPPKGVQVWPIDLIKLYQLTPGRCTLSVKLYVHNPRQKEIAIGIDAMPFEVQMSQ